MKKLMSIVVMLTLAAAANASVLFTEDFESYTAGTALCDTDNWDTFSGTTPGQVTVDNSTGTNAAELTGSQTEDIKAIFSTTGIDSGVLSTTMDVYVTNALSGNYFFCFLPTSGTYYRGRVTIITDGAGGFNFGIAYSASTVYASTVTGYDLNQWYSIKVDLDYNNLSSTLTVLDSGESISEISTLSVGIIDAVGLRQATSGGDLLVDNIVVSQVPEPATMVLLGLGGLLLARKK